MHYSDLLTLPFDERTGIVNLDAILARVPDMPVEVANQFCAEHGRNSEFQQQYGRINLASLSWEQDDLRADELIHVSVFPPFHRWFNGVSERPKDFANQEWSCIDSRRSVQDHWREHRTWNLPPVLLEGRLLGSTETWHLAEGHTRIGLLTGLLRYGILKPESLHTTWLARRAA